MLRIRSTALVTLALLGLGQVQAQQPKWERRVLAMGTTLWLDLSGPSDSQLQAASERALAEIARIEAGISTWRSDSSFSHLNQAQGAAISLEPEWLDLLESVRHQSHRTGGAFDPALWSLIQAWGLREGGKSLSRLALQEARRASGAGMLILDRLKGTAQLRHLKAGIEEGGFGKGYALDRAAKELQAVGTTSGLLDFGGQLLVFGNPRLVTLADPKDRRRPRVSLNLQKASLASTGTSEKGTHILDPKSGNLSPAWGSVAVIAPSGLEADSLSTALFVMGPKKGLRWASTHQIPACFLLNNGQIRMSPAFRALAPSIL